MNLYFFLQRFLVAQVSEKVFYSICRFHQTFYFDISSLKQFQSLAFFLGKNKVLIFPSLTFENVVFSLFVVIDLRGDGPHKFPHGTDPHGIYPHSSLYMQQQAYVIR